MTVNFRGTTKNAKKIEIKFREPEPREELEAPVTNLQVFIWGVLMEARYGKRNMLEILDEAVDELHDDYILLSYADEPTKKEKEQ